MLTVTRHGITSRFDTAPWPEDQPPSLYQPFLQNRFYEQEFLDYIRQLRLPGVYVDVGSCLGTHTVWFGMYCRSTHVYAFDARERCAKWTQMNVDANDLTDKVTVHAVGVGAEPGRASVRLDRIRERFEVVPLDAVVHEPVAVIKIDVEGMEEQVLKGAERILREHHPVVFAEAREDTERAAIEALLATHGYRPTGRVFNSSPTYEFVVSSHKEWIRRAAPRLAKWTRRILSRVRHAATRSH